MKYYIPENLDIDELLEKNPPVFPKGRKFNKDFLIQILDLISTLPALKKDIITDEGFVPLCATELNRNIFGYQYYLSYLQWTGIIISDNKYVTKSWASFSNPVKCIGYKFAATYSVNLKSIENNIPRTPLRKRLFQLSDRKQRDYRHCIKWFNSDLKIDAESARGYIQNWYTSIKDTPYLWKPKEKKLLNGRKVMVGLKDPKYALANYKTSIGLFEDQDFVYNIDGTTRRFHSNITNLKKELRNFITYSGQELVGIDSKNSQPYLSLILFDRRFWLNEHPYLNLRDIRQHYLGKEILKILERRVYKGKHMIDRLGEMQSSVGFQEYQRLTSNGKLYDILFEDYLDYMNSEDLVDTEICDRDSFKLGFVKALYAGNQYTTPIKRIVRNRFPEIVFLFNLIKSGNKNRLSYLLQSIESTLFLLRIAKRIEREYPFLPVYTIHDNIVTLGGYKSNVAKIMKEELLQAVGIQPSFGFEYWNINNPRLSLNL